MRIDWEEIVQKKIQPDNLKKIYTLICAATIYGWEKSLPKDDYPAKDKAEVEKLFKRQQKSKRAASAVDKHSKRNQPKNDKQKKEKTNSDSN